MGDPSVSFSKPKKKKSFSKEELVSNDLEETAGTGSLPKWKKSIPKEEPVTDPDESENEGPQEKAELVFQGGATQQWTWKGCCQQEQRLQEKEKALKAIPGKLEWTSSEWGITYRGIPHSTPQSPIKTKTKKQKHEFENMHAPHYSQQHYYKYQGTEAS